MSVVVNIKENQLIAAAATPLWQYDYGQTVTINNTNIPDGTVSVQFEAKCRDGVIVTAGTSSGGTVVAEIPNQLLAIPIEWNYTIMCYVFVTGEDSGTTRYTAILEVAHRGEQTDEEPTPAQQSAWDAAIATLNQYAEEFQDALYPTVEPITSITAGRCEILEGGYITIGKNAVVNIKIRALTTASNSPSMFYNLPRGVTEAALSCIDITNGIGNSITDSIPCGANKNGTLYMQSIVANHIYSISGSYIAN